MNDGNSAALKRKERGDDKAEDIWQAYAPKIIEDAADDVVEGYDCKIGGKRLFMSDFVETMLDNGIIDCYDVASLICGSYDTQDRIKKYVSEAVIEYLNGKGADYVMRACREAAEDAAT